MRASSIFPLGKLLGLLALRKTFDSALFQRLLAGAAILVLLTVIAALMLAILLAGGLYGIYVALLTYGLAPEASLIMVSSLAVLLTVVVILLMRVQLTRLHGMVRNLLQQQQSPIVSHATSVVEAFISGVLDETPRSKKPTIVKKKG